MFVSTSKDDLVESDIAGAWGLWTNEKQLVHILAKLQMRQKVSEVFNSNKQFPWFIC